MKITLFNLVRLNILPLETLKSETNENNTCKHVHEECMPKLGH